MSAILEPNRLTFHAAIGHSVLESKYTAIDESIESTDSPANVAPIVVAVGQSIVSAVSSALDNSIDKSYSGSIITAVDLVHSATIKPTFSTAILESHIEAD